MDKDILLNYYIRDNKSVSEIAAILNRSETGINYWIKKYQIKKRTISEAIYLKNNPNGDPFDIRIPDDLYLAELRGFGLGLYWGEGNKKNKSSIKLTNSDPLLITKFIEFLVEIFGVKKQDLKFSLQVYSDVDPEIAKKYWVEKLQVLPGQFYNKITVTQSVKKGTYKNRSKNGVVIVYYHNTKLRNILVDMLPL